MITIMPGPSVPAATIFRNSAISLVPYPSARAPRIDPVPHSAAATTRACGNGPGPAPFDGPPSTARDPGLILRVQHEPVHRGLPRPRHHAPAIPARPADPAACPKISRIASLPSRSFASEIDDDAGRQSLSASASSSHASPSVSRSHTPHATPAATARSPGCNTRSAPPSAPGSLPRRPRRITAAATAARGNTDVRTPSATCPARCAPRDRACPALATPRS